MKNLFVSIITMLVTINSITMPNYWDPKNIISSGEGDIFWSFGLSKNGIEQLRHYPRFHKNLLHRIDDHATQFKKFAQERIDENGETNTSETESYRKAIKIIQQAQEEAHDILDPDGLGKKDTVDLEAIIFAPTPEDVLQFNLQTKDQLRELHTMVEGGSRFDEQVPVLVASEENYKKISSFVKEISKGKSLSAKEQALINRAQASLDFAYHFIPISAGFPGNGDYEFFNELAQKPAEQMFILYRYEPELY